MGWQDFIFLAGNVFSLVVLVPTLRDEMSTVPLGTALPSAIIGLIYGTAFATLGMTLSAVGAILTGLMWSLIAYIRSPHPLKKEPAKEPGTHPSPRSPVPPTQQE